MKITTVLDELHTAKCFALERDSDRPINALRKLIKYLPPSKLKYSFLRPHPSGAGISLSGKYGFDEFPLHTDGAHLQAPPDYIILMAPKCRTAPTLIADPRDAINPESDYAKQAIFTVNRGGRRYNSHFLQRRNEEMHFKFNADSMAPRNLQAHEVQRRMLELRRHAIPVNWGRYSLLVIDNRSILHGRGHVDKATSYIRRLEVFLK